MKKNILLLLLLTFTANIYAQYNKNKNINKSSNIISDTSPSNWDLFEKYEKLRRGYQYTSIGSAAISAGLLITYGCTKEKFEFDENGDKKMTDKAKMLIAAGSVSAIVALAFQISAIECKIQSNKYLRLQIGENGPGLAYIF